MQLKLRKSIVSITHVFQEALRLANRMAIMREAVIIQIQRPNDLILNPADDYVCDVLWEQSLHAEDIVDAPKQPLMETIWSV